MVWPLQSLLTAVKSSAPAPIIEAARGNRWESPVLTTTASKTAGTPRGRAPKSMLGAVTVVGGVYSSALASFPAPPTTKTLPSAIRTVATASRADAMLPAGDQLLVAGSYSSALAR